MAEAEANRGWQLVGSYYYNRIMLNFRVNPAALHARLPRHWQVDERMVGSNVTIGFCEVLLRLDEHDRPVPTPSYYYVPVNGPAVNRETGERTNMRYLTLTNRAEDATTPLTMLVLATHSKRVEATGSGTRVEERYVFSDAGGRVVSTQLSYERDVSEFSGRMSVDEGMLVRYPDDPSDLYLYTNEELYDLVRYPDDGIDRLHELDYQVTIADLADLFDGTETLLSMISVPASKREVYARQQ